MKAFLIGIAVLAVITTLSAVVLTLASEPSRVAYSEKDSVRQ